jgi:nitrate/nitrite-specific signal transduction histidine kinase
MAGEHEGYVRRIQEETQRYAQTQLAENERLRAKLVAAETEGVRLRDELATLGEGLRRQESARLELETRLKSLEDENHRFAQDYTEVEQQNANLANLYVASYQLHGTLDREEVLGTIQEIVCNLVGSEEMALFELNGEGGGLELVRSSGIDARPFQRIAPSQGVIGRVARDGRTHLTERDGLEGARPEEAQLTACVPLKLRGKVMAVLALFRLLPQKSGLEPLDQELFDLLADQAAMALYCTGLHGRFTAQSAATQ